MLFALFSLQFQISNRFLDEEFEMAQKKADEYLQKASAITYCSDGWQSLQRNPVVAEVLCCPTPILVRSEKTGPDKKDAEWHLGRMEDSLRLVQEWHEGNSFYS
jgi:hypothetical protein